MQACNSIRFLLGEESKSLTDVAPTMTVLQYLRRVERLTGTKEGCAEGDCGACTVVLGQLENGEIRYMAVNSCIMFVPFLHGKQLIAVEHLKSQDGELHAVQQALVDEHGSQCGFCTPGFVMSMFAMYRNQCDVDKISIDNGLAGNLCRCTGYAPIVRATRKALLSKTEDQFDRIEKDTIQKLSNLNAASSIEVNVGGQKYFAPESTDELARILNRYPDSHIVAGATDVGLWVTKQERHLDSVVYTGAIESLRKIKITDGYIQVGAAVTVSDAMGVLTEHYIALEEIFIRYGSVQIRNLATIGGNVANGSPIGDSLPALVALNAKLVISSLEESRTIAAEDFFIEYGKQDITPGEFLERIDVPLPSEDQEFRMYKLSKRYHQDISAVCGAFSVMGLKNGIQSVRICFGGMAATPLRARNCEKALMESGFGVDGIEKACEALNLDFSPISDFRASSEYRMIAAGKLLERMVNEVMRGEEISVWKVQHA